MPYKRNYRVYKLLFIELGCHTSGNIEFTNYCLELGFLTSGNIEFTNYCLELGCLTSGNIEFTNYCLELGCLTRGNIEFTNYCLELGWLTSGNIEFTNLQSCVHMSYMSHVLLSSLTWKNKTYLRFLLNLLPSVDLILWGEVKRKCISQHFC